MIFKRDHQVLVLLYLGEVGTHGAAMGKLVRCSLQDHA